MDLKTSLKVAAVALCLLPLSFQAQAISRHTSTSTTCTKIHQTILAEGAVIYRWTQAPNISRYGRYVASNNYCGVGERAMPTNIPASDTHSCPVWECKHYDPCDDPLMRLFNRDRC